MSENRIPLLIINNAQKLIEQLVPSITQITIQTGIQNIGQPNLQMPGTCLTQSELQNILNLRNNLIDKLNTISKTIDLLSKPLNSLTTVVNTTKNGLNIGKSVLSGIEAVLIATPPAIPIPGSAISGYIKAYDLINNILPPIITTASNKITSISEALNYANNIIFKLLNLLKIIDQYLLQCGVNSSSLTPISDIVNQIDTQYTEAQNQSNQLNGISQVYQGFTLEIVEEPFSSTVNRKKAVAKNSSGIILLQTPPSFTSTPQILIQQLKLIIDNSDLKAI